MLSSLPLFRSMRSRSRTRYRRRPAAAGFSLVEMLVVVAIVGLLIGLVGPAAMRQLESSKVRTTQAQIAQLRSAIDIYMIDTGRYPSQEEGLAALVTPGNTPGWGGPYVRDGKLPEDPWGNPYSYSIESSQVRITSFGADGRKGGQGSDADVSG